MAMTPKFNPDNAQIEWLRSDNQTRLEAQWRLN